ncbi:MAG: hypothetical protein ACR2KT_17625 [Methylocella sp.]
MGSGADSFKRSFAGGTMLRPSFDHTKEDALRAALAGISPPVPPPA